MTPTQCIHHVPPTHTHNVLNSYNATPWERPRWNPDIRHNEPSWASVPVTGQKKRAHRWWSTDARPKITRERSCKRTLTLYTETPDPTEQAARRCHCRNKYEPSNKVPMTLLGMSKCIYLIQESFTLPCIPFIIPFISAIYWQGLCTNRGTDTETH